MNISAIHYRTHQAQATATTRNQKEPTTLAAGSHGMNLIIYYFAEDFATNIPSEVRFLLLALFFALLYKTS